MRLHAQGILKSASMPISPYGFECSIKKTLSPAVCIEMFSMGQGLGGLRAAYAEVLPTT
ncbi:MAG: hypothetical protein J6B10_10265 [Lachnospiraceae bacterium]|nr:hypothetical protein [Lachnospiraceae bacterium]